MKVLDGNMGNLKNDYELRRKIQEITDKYIGHAVEKQKELIAQLSSEHTHSILLIKEAIPGDPSTFQYTCHMYTFDLIGLSEVEKIAAEHEDIFPGSDYVEFMITNKYLREKTWEEAKDGDVIIYFDNGKPSHSGKIYRNRIISKWGLANTWEHDIYEVPISYGEQFKIYSSIEQDSSLQAFIEYAKLKGGADIK